MSAGLPERNSDLRLIMSCSITIVYIIPLLSWVEGSLVQSSSSKGSEAALVRSIGSSFS